MFGIIIPDNDNIASQEYNPILKDLILKQKADEEIKKRKTKNID